MIRRLTTPNNALFVTLALAMAACGTGPSGTSPGLGYDLDAVGLPTDAVAAVADGKSSADAASGRPDAGGQNDGANGRKDSAAQADGAATTADTSNVDASLEDSAPGVDAGLTDTGTGTTDTGTTDTGTADTGTVVDAGSEPDNGPSTNDVPWGSNADAGVYDAGQFNYSDIKNTGGNTGSGGAGLCIPKISQLNLEKIKTGGKVDIIIFVDTSGSMGQEAKYVSKNLNNFGKYLAQASLDYRVILIGKDAGCCKLNIGAPLLNDSKRYLRVNKGVYSLDGLQKLISYYPSYQGFLRADATKNFLAITDDESKYMTAASFEQKLMALQNPGFKSGFIFHSIVAYGPLPGRGCKTGARIGYQYLKLTTKTGGVKAPVCDSNWTKIFTDIAKGIVKTAKPACSHKIPLPAGVGNAKGVTVNYVAEDDFFNVPPAKNNACGANGVGYTMDNPNQPSKITLCNKSCDLLKGGGNIQFDFGCNL